MPFQQIPFLKVGLADGKFRFAKINIFNLCPSHVGFVVADRKFVVDYLYFQTLKVGGAFIENGDCQCVISQNRFGER